MYFVDEHHVFWADSLILLSPCCFFFADIYKPGFLLCGPFTALNRDSGLPNTLVEGTEVWSPGMHLLDLLLRAQEMSEVIGKVTVILYVFMLN